MGVELFIIDIDDTFIYHRTVGFGNYLFLKNWYSLFSKEVKKDIYKTIDMVRLIFNVNPLKFNPSTKKIYNMLYLSYIGILLHIVNCYRKIANYFYYYSNEYMILTWQKCLRKLKITESFDKKIIAKHINIDLINKIKNDNFGKILAISQNVLIDNDGIKDLLGIDYLFENSVRKLIVKNKFDKLKIANTIIDKLKPKKIGIIIEDYDDLSLLELENIELILISKQLKKYIKFKKAKPRIEILGK